MQRLLYILLPFIAACSVAKPSPEVAETALPAATILTVIFEIDPKLDTLTVFDVIRGPGKLRTDYPPTAEAVPGELRFSFVDANGKTLRQTTQPYPAANRYESPGDNGEIQSTTLQEEPRSLVLKTQASRRLHALVITGQLPTGTSLNQRIDLRPRK